MYHQSPDVTRYVGIVQRWRKPILVLYALLMLLAVAFYQPTFLSSDAMFWLKDARELKKSEARDFSIQTLSKLTVSVERFDDVTKEKLIALNDALSRREGVERVFSLFSHDLGEVKGGNGDSEMVGVVNVGDMESYRIKRMIKEMHNDYCNIVDSDFRTFRFFISATKPLSLAGLEIPGSYRYETTEASIDWTRSLLFILGGVVMLIVLFRLMFRNFIVAGSALAVMGINTVGTFTLMYLITGIEAIHMTMPFITISISLVDFLFFYYRWHVSFYKHDTDHALTLMLERNVAPALWTSFITAVGLGGLLFVDSDIVRLLCLSVMLSSIVGYAVNLTFLPALLSHFDLEHPRVPYTKLGFFLASSELHYNRKFLYGFLGVTFVLIILGGYMIYGKSKSFFELNVQNEQVVLKIPYEQIDLSLVQSIETFTKDLKTAFEDDLGEVISLSSIVHSLNDANSQTEVLDEEALLQALFYLDLYGLAEKYYDADAVTVQINLFDINKVALIEWLSQYEPLDIYFVDKATLLGSAQFNQTVLLTSSLLSALVIIAVVMGWIFRSAAMAFVGFTVNAVPVAWFGLIVKLLEVPLGLEMLIAMTISVGLASDATIHFAYKYFRGRYTGISRKHSLDKMYFYAGIPVIIGSVILIIVFAAFDFAEVHTLQLIGTYSALLILISLLTDLFVLPVMLLFIDRFDDGKNVGLSRRKKSGADERT